MPNRSRPESRPSVTPLVPRTGVLLHCIDTEKKRGGPASSSAPLVGLIVVALLRPIHRKPGATIRPLAKV